MAGEAPSRDTKEVQQAHNTAVLIICLTAVNVKYNYGDNQKRDAAAGFGFYGSTILYRCTP